MEKGHNPTICTHARASALCIPFWPCGTCFLLVSLFLLSQARSVLLVLTCLGLAPSFFLILRVRDVRGACARIENRVSKGGARHPLLTRILGSHAQTRSFFPFCQFQLIFIAYLPDSTLNVLSSKTLERSQDFSLTRLFK